MSLNLNDEALSDDVQILVGLGLTVLQARVYLSLTKLGTAHAGTISRFSNVGRQDIYRILSELYNLGLVKKILTSPTEFEPEPIKQCVSLLLKVRDAETSQLRKKASLLRWKFEQIEGSVNREGLKLSMIPRKEMLDFEAVHSIENAKESIKLITDGNKFKREPQIWKSFYRSLKRGTKIQIIIIDAEDAPVLPKYMETYVNEKLFQIKHNTNKIIPGFMICDNRAMFIPSSERGDSLTTTKCLYLDIITLVKIASCYFDTFWEKSAPVMIFH